MEDHNQSMIEYLSTLNCDCILFLDEFEKNFKEEDSTILQIMDGVYNSNHRKVFLLTTNVMTVNENLLGRPSRIRYVKHFGNLTLDTVNEYLDDALKCEEARAEILDYIDTLTISTIDILKTIVNEVNIHGMEGLKRAKSFFNVQTNEYSYSVLRGYAYESAYNADPSMFSINKFVEAIEHYTNPLPKPIVDDEDHCTAEEREALNKYYEYRRHNFHSISYDYIDSDIKFQGLQIGDEWDGESIVALDKKRGIIVTKNDNCYKFWFVKDPNAKPSLYKRGAHEYVF